MNLDAVTLRAILNELRPQLERAFLQKFSQLSEEDYLIAFRSGEKTRLLICLRPGECRLHAVEGSYQAVVPSSFAMLCRKHLQGRRLEEVTQPGLERLVTFSCGPERPRLVAELLGQHNNLFLVSPHDKILGYHRTPQDDRRLRVGRDYEPPARPDRPWADQVSGQQLVAQLKDEDLPREIRERVFGLPRSFAPALTSGGIEELAGRWDRLWEQLADPAAYRPGVRGGGLTFQAGPGDVAYPSLQKAAEALWKQASRVPGLEQRRNELQRRLGKRLAKAGRKLERRHTDLNNTLEADTIKNRADLLLAHLHKARPGCQEIELPDWDPEQPPVLIKLDPRLSASENAQAMYSRYQKLKRAVGILGEQVAVAQDEVVFLEEVKLALELADEATELDEIATMLAPRRRAAPSAPSSGPRRFRHGPFELLVGRNPAQNDRLVMHTAARDDLWFHAREIPGSHVILRTAGRKPGDDALLAAAVLAARYSRGSASTKVPVSYTRLHYVRKPPGSPPGKVIYRKEKTIMVDPQAVIEGLEASS